MRNIDKDIEAPVYFDLEEDEKQGLFLLIMLRGNEKEKKLSLSLKALYVSLLPNGTI